MICYDVFEHVTTEGGLKWITLSRMLLTTKAEEMSDYDS